LHKLSTVVNNNLQFLCPLILAVCENENKLREIFPSMSHRFACELIVGVKSTAHDGKC